MNSSFAYFELVILIRLRLVPYSNRKKKKSCYEYRQEHSIYVYNHTLSNLIPSKFDELSERDSIHLWILNRKYTIILPVCCGCGWTEECEVILFINKLFRIHKRWQKRHHVSAYYLKCTIFNLNTDAIAQWWKTSFLENKWVTYLCWSSIGTNANRKIIISGQPAYA